MNRLEKKFRGIAARLFSERVLERVIDPFLADLQLDYASAGRSPWRRRWVSIAGSLTFLKLIVVCGWAQSTRAVREESTEDRRLFRRAFVVSFGIATLFIFLFIKSSAAHWPEISVALLVPSSLAMAIPLGVTVGLFCVLGGREASRSLMARTVMMAFVCCVLLVATTAWITPGANREFRYEAYLTSIRRTDPNAVIGRSLADGANEMSMTELHELAVLSGPYGVNAYSYHMHIALAFATGGLGLFTLAVMPRRRTRLWLLCAMGVAVWVGYCSLFEIGWAAVNRVLLPVIVAAWLPNATCIAAAGLILYWRVRRNHQITKSPIHQMGLMDRP